jgi:hypothetical protein
MSEAKLRIWINDRWLYLETPAPEERVEHMDVVGFDGDSEQCEDCGHDIQENGVFAPFRLEVICDRCGANYGVEAL